jgi:hypothetical protein
MSVCKDTIQVSSVLAHMKLLQIELMDFWSEHENIQVSILAAYDEW